MKFKEKILKTMILAIATVVPMVTFVAQPAFADSEFSVSPMRQKIVLTPGENFQGSFEIVNPVSSQNIFNYKLGIKPFYVDEKDSVVFENNGDYNQIVEWITFANDTGSIEPNSTKTVYFNISVPEDAPAGGQYATIIVSSNDELIGNSEGVNIQNILSIGHIIYAEVLGDTNREGEIEELSIPGFLFDGNISASSVVKNYGNVHGTAKYTLQVYPLFSDEEVYTNEENPDEKTVMPERELYNTTYWYDTPGIGVFNVVYKVDFDGITTAEFSKMVIKCPIWLLFIVIFVIFALVFYFVARARARKKAAKK